MFSIKFGAVLLCAGTLVLAGCEHMGDKEATGTVVGGVAGALAGSQFGKGDGRLVTTALGALVGAGIGGSVGNSMDETDRLKSQAAFNNAAAAPVGKSITWYNEENGNHGSVVATREGRANDGAYCREFQQNVVVAGKEQQAYGTACRQPDGTWKIVK